MKIRAFAFLTETHRQEWRYKVIQSYLYKRKKQNRTKQRERDISIDKKKNSPYNQMVDVGDINQVGGQLTYTKFLLLFFILNKYFIWIAFNIMQINY